MIGESDTHLVCERQVTRFDRDRLWGYILGLRLRGNNTESISLAFDGVKSMGKECLNIFVQWAADNCGFWLPFQALRAVPAAIPNKKFLKKRTHPSWERPSAKYSL
eukprot:1596801-Amphidinium_carterae.2